MTRRVADLEFTGPRDATPGELASVIPGKEPRGTTEVQEHGELGPILVDGTQDFTTAREAEKRRRQ